MEQEDTSVPLCSWVSIQVRIEIDEDHLLLLNPPEGPLSDFVLAATQAIVSGQSRISARNSTIATDKSPKKNESQLSLEGTGRQWT